MTSRAYLPQQDMSKGHLQVLVVEGKLEGLKGADNSKLTDRELAMAFPGKSGEILNLREIEQAVDQLNRLPSNQAQMELTPGEAVGGSSVLVKNTPQSHGAPVFHVITMARKAPANSSGAPALSGTARWAWPIS